MNRSPTDPGGLGKYLNLALLLPISTLVGFVIGYGLDAIFHTGWIRFVFLVVGALAGFVEAFRVLTQEK